MQSFMQKFAENVTGAVECFDRVIFKGHVRSVSYPEGMEKMLGSQGVLIKDFARFVRTHSDHLVERAKGVAARQSRPYQYLRRKIRKDEEAGRIAERDGISEGLICIFSELGSCPSFKVIHAQQRPRIQSDRRKCLPVRRRSQRHASLSC